MSEARRPGTELVTPGPTVSFGFNLGEVAGHGEIIRVGNYARGFSNAGMCRAYRSCSSHWF